MIIKSRKILELNALFILFDTYFDSFLTRILQILILKILKALFLSAQHVTFVKDVCSNTAGSLKVCVGALSGYVF